MQPLPGPAGAGGRSVFEFQWPWMALLLLVPLVGWARVRLKRHTLRQVIYGSLVGVLIALIFVHSFLLDLL